MAEVLCEVKAGLRPAEASVMIRDLNGRREFLPVDRGMLAQEGERYYLSVGLIHIDEQHQAALIALPVEADSGANRIWIPLDRLHLPSGSPS